MSENPPPTRRLNPFAFPSETDGRFILLIIAALALTVSTAYILRYIVDPRDSQIYKPIVLAKDTPLEVFRAQLTETLPLIALQVVNGVCLPLIMMGAIFMLAFIPYRLHAWRIRHSYRLQPLERETDPVLYNAVQMLAQKTNLPLPIIEASKKMQAQGAQAFGFGQRFSLRLDGGLRLLLRKSPEKFQSVVLHELGHIANGDVGRTYFSQALWSSVIGVAFVLLTTGIVFLLIQAIVLSAAQHGFARINWSGFLTGNLPTTMILAFQITAILGIVWLTRAGLLRTREVYADWRAALWGAAQGLIKILQTEKSQEGFRYPWLTMWRLHPTPQERATLLQNPNDLFHLKLDVPFTAGMLLALILDGAFSILPPILLGINDIARILRWIADRLMQSNMMFSWLLQFPIYGIHVVNALIAIIPVITIAYLVTWTVGAQVQRETLAELALQRRGWGSYLHLAIAAAVITLGIEIGNGLNLRGNVMTINFLGLLFAPAWWFATIFFTWLWLIYARFLSKSLWGYHVGTSPPKWRQHLFSLILATMLCMLYTGLMLIRALIDTGFGLQFFVLTLIWFGMMSIIAFTLYFLAFGTTWALAQIFSFLFPPHCPSCKQIVRQKEVLDKSCEHCGHELAAWLFVEPPMQSDPSSPTLQIHSRP